MTASFVSGSLRGNSLFAPMLPYETWCENVIYFCHNAVIHNNSNYSEFIYHSYYCWQKLFQHPRNRLIRLNGQISTSQASCFFQSFDNSLFEDGSVGQPAIILENKTLNQTMYQERFETKAWRPLTPPTDVFYRPF